MIKNKLMRTVKKAKIKFQRTLLDKRIAKARKKREVAKFSTTLNERLETNAKNLITKFSKVEFKGGKTRKYTVETRSCPEWNDCYEANYQIRTYLSGAEGVRGAIGWLGLGFDRKAVVIEIAQTAIYGEFKQYLNEFRRLSKKPVLYYLMEKLEQEARLNGFEQVKMRIPETMYFFEKPNLQNTKLTADEVRLHLKKFYAKLAREQGYKREGLFYIKQL